MQRSAPVVVTVTREGNQDQDVRRNALGADEQKWSRSTEIGTKSREDYVLPPLGEWLARKFAASSSGATLSEFVGQAAPLKGDNASAQAEVARARIVRL